MTQQRRFFLAIRHKPSGGFLPAVKGYGFTRTEPTREAPPRLFEKMGPCKQALSYWLEGELFEVGIESEDGSQNLRLIRKPNRRASEMEIVEIEIVARTLTEAELRRL